MCHKVYFGLIDDLYMGTGMLSQTGLSELRKNRSHFDIMAIMLENSKNGAATYSLVKHTNISFSQFKKYLATLQNIGLVETCEEEGRRFYRASDKGLEYLKQYYALQRILSIK